MEKIKPIEYEKIVIKIIDEVYKNFRQNYQSEFIAPQNIDDYFKKTNSLKTIEDLKNFGIEFDKTFKKWEVKDGDIKKTITLNHFLSILQNAVIVIMSIDKSLESEKLPLHVVDEKIGLNIIVATAVQAVGLKANELVAEFEKLNLKNDPLIIFEKLNNLLNKIKNLDATQAFSLLMNNILEFNQVYSNCYEKLSQIQIDDFTSKRISMFMSYMNTYYLFVYLLHLTLIYPKQEGLLEEKVFQNIIPDIKLLT